MRQSTLAVLSWLIVFPVIYLLPYAAEAAGAENFPRWSMAATGIASFVAAGVLSAVLMPLNKHLLAWRKERGRDIEAEERYETASGMVRLTPNDEEQDRH